MKKKTILILCGGRSTEHGVSLLSAKNVVIALSEKKYDKVIVVIDQEGIWRKVSRDEFERIVSEGGIKKKKKSFLEVVCGPNKGRGMRLFNAESGKIVAHVDVVFPVMHGGYGEDGTIQGMLEMMNIAYVGAGVLASALGMDKEMTKRVLREANIESTPFAVLHKEEVQKNFFREYKKRFGLPFFIKPARSGSSVGVHKVCSEREFFSSVREAFLYDDKILVEEMIVGREIECAVMGKEDSLKVSQLGEVEICGKYHFYSYEAKCAEGENVRISIPAKIAPSIEKKIRALAGKSYQALGCQGMARIDFFVTMRGRIYVNEINTLPGFTDKSVYPKLWEQEGIALTQLVEKLLRDAEQRRLAREKLLNRYEEG